MKDLYYEYEKDLNCDLFITQQKEYNGRLHFHRAFELAYIIEGNAKYTVEDQNFIVQSGDMFFSHRYYSHRCSDKLPHKKYVIAVPENFSLSLTMLLREETLPPLLSDKDFNRTLVPIINKLHKDKNLHPVVVKGYINVIFGSLFDHYSTVTVKPKNKNVSRIEKILLYLDAHYMQPLTSDEVALQLGYSNSYFSRLFNQCIGSSFNSYLNALRLDKFEELAALSPTKSITELAFECGFTSLATFYRAKHLRSLGLNHNNTD